MLAAKSVLTDDIKRFISNFDISVQKLCDSAQKESDSSLNIFNHETIKTEIVEREIKKALNEITKITEVITFDSRAVGLAGQDDFQHVYVYYGTLINLFIFILFYILRITD